MIAEFITVQRVTCHITHGELHHLLASAEHGHVPIHRDNEIGLCSDLVVHAEQLQTAEYTAQATSLAQGRVDLQTRSLVPTEQFQTAEIQPEPRA